MRLLKAAMIMAFTVGFTSMVSAGTLDEVRKRGELVCGVEGALAGFSSTDDKGKMIGIDADVCYAIAAAVFASDKDGSVVDAKSKVRFVPLTSKERFTALSSGEIDVLSRITTHTLSRDATLGVNFTYYNYIDGQGFLVKKSSGIKSAKELDGAQVCITPGTTTELNLADYFRVNGMTYKPVGYETAVQTRSGFEKDTCDVLTSDKSQLASIRSELKDPSSAFILSETISKEPLGPLVRQGDDEWFNIVKWTLYAMINAEELGVTSKNVDDMKSTKNPSIRRLLGLEGTAGEDLGLSPFWAKAIVKTVGNYGESYERNIAPLGLERKGSVNDLWTRGGILYAPPIR